MCKTEHFERERERVLFIEWGNGVRKILYYSKLKYYIIDLNKLVSEKNVKKIYVNFSRWPHSIVSQTHYSHPLPSHISHVFNFLMTKF